MSESLFSIFGDHITRQAVRNVSRQPLSNIENMGKIASAGPVKPNEPVKRSEGPKKSFLSNTGKALKNTPVRNVFTPVRNVFTPVRNVFTPRAVNVGSMIYNDENKDNEVCGADIEFHRPSYKYDNYHRDLLDYLPVPEPEILKQFSPPNTPPPATKRYSMDFNCSYQDEFFKVGGYIWFWSASSRICILRLHSMILKQFSPPNTPPPATKRYSMDFNCSYQDEFFKDDFSIGSVLDEDLDLPDLY